MDEQSNKLQTMLDKILKDKNTNLTPDNLREGTICLGIEGKLQEKIDESDATATVNDISKGKIAYVNSEKIVGTVNTKESGDGTTYQIESFRDIPDKNKFEVGITNKDNILYKNNSYNNMQIPYDAITDTYEISSEKIIEGNTILGITGTGKTTEDLQAQLDAQDAIIQELQQTLDNKAIRLVKPNIFVQEIEPTTKKGIWVQSNLEYEVIDDCPIFEPIGHMSKNISSGGFCRIDDWMYILGGYWFNPETKKGETTARCFKINLDTYEEVELADWIGCNSKTYDMMCANIGNKIYMSTGNDTSPVIYIYDVDNNTWEAQSFTRPTTSTGSTGKGYSLYSYNNNLYMLFYEGIYQVDTTTFELTELAIIDGARFTYESKPTAYNATGSQVLITGSYYIYNFPSVIFDFDTLNSNRLVLDFKDHAAVFAVSNLSSIFSFSGRNTLKNFVTEVYQYKYPLTGRKDNNRIIGKFPMQFSSYAWCYYNNYVYIFGGYMDTPTGTLSTSRVDSIYKISLDLSKVRVSNTIVLNDTTRSIKQFNVELVDGIYTQLNNIGVYEDGEYNANRNVYIGTGTEWIQIAGSEE